MTNDDFDPDDISEIEDIFTQIISDNEDGFVMEFGISVLAAKELIDLWTKANNGSRMARIKSWNEYSKIIRELELAVYGDNTN
ncbi:hypothetical protein UFOVP582_2 [uncultured Caudovirales phage]|uniref:Uncharacterized protein n=1 Tax=uncultured Caudovirales phage TaxID=2100421 RepID=A0A6J5QIX6_9CAUD|nr:hypothetical protein UFOVP582_2 [uncultured Caudovirales phage]CAB4184303.1 hypothetical protein UFOVP1099_52 [uncultured Caudovirales phage]CAB4213946.1 hypothetical protein UFOVP1460_5 [uncultured Caudovirales phage]CAB5228702.1 hypothetical protein UFOVP1548_24 [uncultured Caudovirales phage]